MVRAISAQELNEPVFSLPDSLKSLYSSKPEPMPDALLFNQIFSPELTLPSFQLQVPAFDINKYLNNTRVIHQMSFSSAFPNTFLMGNIFSPGLSFAHSAAIFNQAAYQIYDKIILGGNSFGVNSIFGPPVIHPFSDQWQTRGASMFMQYKVNKNFKIETRISVSGTPHHP